MNHPCMNALSMLKYIFTPEPSQAPVWIQRKGRFMETLKLLCWIVAAIAVGLGIGRLN